MAGWVVDERRPLDPPETADGSRADALANVAILRRPDELSREEWLHRWLEHHTPVAIETQATFGYLQNVVVAPVTPDAPRVDALVEELFPPEAITDIHAFYGSGGDDAELDQADDPADGERGDLRRRPRPRPGAEQPLPLRAPERPAGSDRTAGSAATARATPMPRTVMPTSVAWMPYAALARPASRLPSGMIPLEDR